MLQLHLSDQEHYCLLRCDLYWRFYSSYIPSLAVAIIQIAYIGCIRHHHVGQWTQIPAPTIHPIEYAHLLLCFLMICLYHFADLCVGLAISSVPLHWHLNICMIAWTQSEFIGEPSSFLTMVKHKANHLNDYCDIPHPNEIHTQWKIYYRAIKCMVLCLFPSANMTIGIAMDEKPVMIIAI